MGSRGAVKRRAVFLDRDGTLIHDRHYLADPDGVELVEGGAEAIRSLQGVGLAVVVVTNQSGIGRGLFTEDAYRAVEARIDALLAADGVHLDGTYHCPHDPRARCDCRKPGIGLHRLAAGTLDLSLAGSYFVGDKPADVEPAQRLEGVGMLVRTGHGRRHEDEVAGLAEVFDDLPQAARKIVALERR